MPTSFKLFSEKLCFFFPSVLYGRLFLYYNTPVPWLLLLWRQSQTEERVTAVFKLKSLGHGSLEGNLVLELLN